MTPIFVHVETVEGRLDPEALGIASALARSGGSPHAVLAGDLDPAGFEALARHGVAAATVVAPTPDADRSPSRALADTVAALAARHPAGRWLAPTTTVTTEAAAIAAARLDAGLWWRIVDVDVDGGDLVATQVGADATSVRTVEWRSAWGLGLVRPHAFTPEVVADGAAVPVDRWPAPPTSGRPPRIVERRPAAIAGAGLADADIIVAGGRGLGDRERLDLVRELADLLGGTAGVSLPLVEAGWAPRSMQVGQTGTVVAPRLYVACGISGQIQHRVGMERSTWIVAVNTDADAPIMSFCDLAVVADAGAVLPDLIAALRGG